MRLVGQVALVTGAGRGIGRAIALRFATEGAAIALLARTAAEIDAAAAEIEAFGTRGRALCVDITDDTALAAAVEHAREELGPVSILVNNAGCAPPRTALEHVRVADVDSMLDTNLRAAILLTRRVLPEMRRNGHGCIVTLSSAFAMEPHAGEAVYAATKAGLLAFSRALALECARDGIRVAALCPEHVDTAFIPPNRRIDRSAFLRPEDIAEAALAFVLGETETSEVEIPVRRDRGAA